ncbi:MAG: hypothetical protein HUJ94_00140 [Bacteroidales bacterium]|nr:hypothetical protein [Bacteroidales bacterium]
MKKYIFIGLIAALFFTSSCSKWESDVKAPKVSISVSPTNPKVGDVVTVTVTTDAEYLSIFTGDKGHDFENSQVKYQMQYGDAVFKEKVLSEQLSLEGATWKRTMADYATLEDLKKDFEFFGAVDNIQLGEFERPACSQIDMSHKKVLKFSITDRQTISGIIFHPDVHLYNWDIFYEMRLVPCQEDSVARFVGRTNREVHALWNMTLKCLADGKETVCSGDYWNGSGPWCWDYYFYIYPTYEPVFPPRNDGSFCEFYSVRDRIKNQNPYGFAHPDEYVASEMKIGFGWPRQPWENGPDYVLDEKGFPANLGNYHGFQGDVYISSIQWGQDVYSPYDQGVSLGSEYTGLGITRTYEYIYTEGGEYNIVAVATNVGRKQYSGDGYKTERSSYDSEYIKYRSTDSVKINVSGE